MQGADKQNIAISFVTINLITYIILTAFLFCIHFATCTEVPNQPYEQPDFVAASPWMMLRSSDPDLNCTVALMVGPNIINGDPNYNVILLRENAVTYSFNINAAVPQINYTILTSCHTGVTYVNKFLHNDLTGPNPYFIAYYCDESSGSITLVKGYAKNQNTGCVIDNVIGQYLSNIPGAEKVVPVWNNCPCSPYCGGYFD